MKSLRWKTHGLAFVALYAILSPAIAINCSTGYKIESKIYEENSYNEHHIECAGTDDEPQACLKFEATIELEQIVLGLSSSVIVPKA